MTWRVICDTFNVKWLNIEQTSTYHTSPNLDTYSSLLVYLLNSPLYLLLFLSLVPEHGFCLVRKRCVRKFHTNGRLSFGTTEKTPLPRSCRQPYGDGLLFSNGRCVGRESSAPFKRFLVCCKKALARNRGTFVLSDKCYPLSTVS